MNQLEATDYVPHHRELPVAPAFDVPLVSAAGNCDMAWIAALVCPSIATLSGRAPSSNLYPSVNNARFETRLWMRRRTLDNMAA